MKSDSQLAGKHRSHKAAVGPRLRLRLRTEWIPLILADSREWGLTLHQHGLATEAKRYKQSPKPLAQQIGTVIRWHVRRANSDNGRIIKIRGTAQQLQNTFTSNKKVKLLSVAVKRTNSPGRSMCR
ncbi:hypothetical protein PMIN03_003495 [Paraphaeosphaeria minitans]